MNIHLRKYKYHNPHHQSTSINTRWVRNNYIYYSSFNQNNRLIPNFYVAVIEKSIIRWNRNSGTLNNNLLSILQNSKTSNEKKRTITICSVRQTRVNHQHLLLRINKQYWTAVDIIDRNSYYPLCLGGTSFFTSSMLYQKKIIWKFQIKKYFSLHKILEVKIEEKATLNWG